MIRRWQIRDKLSSGLEKNLKSTFALHSHQIALSHSLVVFQKSNQNLVSIKLHPLQKKKIKSPGKSSDPAERKKSEV